MELKEYETKALIMELKSRNAIKGTINVNLDDVNTTDLLSELCKRHTDIVIVGFPKVNPGALMIKPCGDKLRILAFMGMVYSWMRKDVAGGFFECATNSWGQPDRDPDGEPEAG